MHGLAIRFVPRTLASGASMLLLGSACSSLASESDLLPTSTPEGPWRCLGSASSRTNALVNGARFDYPLQVLDLATRRPPGNLKVRACALSDLACSRPITPEIGLNADGRVVLPLSLGFDGFLELTADRMRPTLTVFAEPLSTELATLMASQPSLMLSQDSLRALDASLGAMISDQAGQIALTALDCDGLPAAGMRVQVAAPAVPFAIISGLPVAQRDTTGADGIIGFVNVAAGVAVVNPSIVALSASLDPRTLPIRSGWITQTTLLPGPLPFE